MARAHRKTLSSEEQTAQNRVSEAENLLQSLKTEVQVVQLRVQEADEHIGFILEFLRRQRLYQLTQHPISTQPPVEAPSSPINTPSSDGAISGYSEPDDDSEDDGAHVFEEARSNRTTCQVSDLEPHKTIITSEIGDQPNVLSTQ